MTTDGEPPADISGPTVPRIILGNQLHRFREAAGISPDRAGYEIRASRSKISRMENGKVGFKERDVADLLDLAALLHSQLVEPWLRLAGAPLDLREHVVLLARRAAERRETPAALGVAAQGGVHVALGAGARAFGLAQAELDAVAVPTTDPESMQVAGMLALSRALVASIAGRPVEADAVLAHAGELAERTGEGNAYWMAFGPTNVGLWRIAAAREADDPERAVTIAESLHPEAQPRLGCHANYWVHYGRALARLRGRRDDAVRALRRAETILPHMVQRNPHARETLAELLARAGHDDPVSRELRGMAHRAGLLV